MVLGLRKSESKAQSEQSKTNIHTEQQGNLKTLKLALQNLYFKYNFSENIFEDIDINTVVDDDASDDSFSEALQTKDEKETKPTISFQLQKTDETPTVSDFQRLQQTQQNTRQIDKMALTRKELMRTAPQMVAKYDGDPLLLTGFIDSVKLLAEMVDDEHKPVFTKFVMTRLEGLAREAVDDNPENINEIIQQLEANIKVDSSKVIEGRMLALRTDKMNLTKFSERAEELAEEFR